MDKGFKKRIGFWGFMFVLMVLISVFGVMKYYDGYGKKGRARKTLMPICETFNNLDTTIRYGGLNCVVDQDKILVTYSTKSSSKTFEYNLSYEGNNTYLKNTYDEQNVAVGENIAKFMTDTIYHINGGKGTIFDTYDFILLYQMPIKTGVMIEDKTTSTDVTIDISKKIKDEITTYVESDEGKEKTQIVSKDLTVLKNQLILKKSFSIARNSMTFVVKETDKAYEIYANSLLTTNESFFVNSIYNIVAELDQTVWAEMKANNVSFKQDDMQDDYRIEKSNIYVDEDENLKVFTMTSGVIKVTIYKK